ncbi:MAG: MFS transporter [Anaerolineales bacterium]|nr:MFS transporter [Anaerolineales bacterium]
MSKQEITQPHNGKPRNGKRRYGMQRRFNLAVDHLRPQRWNWSALMRPLDQQVVRHTDDVLQPTQVFSLRYFWLDGFFSAVSDNFYLSFIPLFALAYGASNGEVGWLTAVGNLLGAIALFPGARLAERATRRQPLVLWSGGGVARLALLGFACIPLVVTQPKTAVFLIILLNGLRAFMANFANPAWTAIVADLVPDFARGRYLGSRNMAMGLAALAVTTLAGRLINLVNDWRGSEMAGYQVIFALSFLFGMVSTFSFSRIIEPSTSTAASHQHQRGDLRRILRTYPGFAGLIISAFVWNIALQIAAPFFNVYLVNKLGATATTIGILASVSSLSALAGQQVFGRLLDEKGALWVQQVCGFIIPILPLTWLIVTAPWQVGVFNLLGGFVWAGYNLSNFNLLLQLTPDEQRPRAVALFQTAVFGGAVLGPLLGGYLADVISFKFIFGLSGVGRLLGMILFTWLTAHTLRHNKQKLSEQA